LSDQENKDLGRIQARKTLLKKCPPGIPAREFGGKRNCRNPPKENLQEETTKKKPAKGTFWTKAAKKHGLNEFSKEGLAQGPGGDNKKLTGKESWHSNLGQFGVP